jgi:hypothetical protein
MDRSRGSNFPSGVVFGLVATIALTAVVVLYTRESNRAQIERQREQLRTENSERDRRQEEIRRATAVEEQRTADQKRKEASEKERFVQEHIERIDKLGGEVDDKCLACNGRGLVNDSVVGSGGLKKELKVCPLCRASGKRNK